MDKPLIQKQLVIIADSDPRTTIVGGVGTYSFHLAAQLENSYDIIFVAKKQPTPNYRIPHYNVRLATPFPGYSNSKFLKGLFKVAHHLSTPKGSIIHAQRPDWLLPFVFRKAIKVVTLHGSHFKNLKLKKGRWIRTLYRIVEYLGLYFANHIIAVDQRTQKEFAERFPRLASKIRFIPVGVDIKLFSPVKKVDARKKLKLPLTKKVLLYVGRLSKEKNIGNMIKVLANDEILIIVGNGEEESFLKSLAKNKDVRFVGSRSQSELVDFYSASDALLLLSDHEGLPTVVLEAFACDLPGVATPVGQLPDLIEPSKTGFIISKSLSTRKAIDAVYKIKSVGACRRTASKYSWVTVIKQIQNEVYK